MDDFRRGSNKIRRRKKINKHKLKIALKWCIIGILFVVVMSVLVYIANSIFGGDFLLWLLLIYFLCL
jgi:hypothetical protein